MRNHVIDLLEAAKKLVDVEKDDMLSYLISMAIVEASTKATMNRRVSAA